MSTSPVPPAGKKGDWMPWLLGLGAGAVVLLIVGGLLIAGYVARGLRVNETAREVKISTPAGELTVSKTTGGDVGLPVYPGATVFKNGGNVEFRTPEEEERVGLTVAHYRTSDPFAKVEAWYREHLGPEFERDDKSAGRGKIRIGGIEREGVAYVSDKDDLVRFVALAKKRKGVDIALGRIGKQEPQ